ncbi:DUF3397 domain-containing protein [Streptococcus suis]|nr:DUF3397 domain-containing protein [Streptococcus suis]
MIILKIASILFLILTLAASIIAVKLFGLEKKGWNFADIAFPLYFIESYIISDRMFYHSLLPHLVLLLGLLAIGIASFFLLKKRSFSYRRFFKFFWRSGFILTFLFYLALVITLFTLK